MNPPFVSYIDIIDSDLYFRASRHPGAIRKGIEASGVQIQEIILHPADIVSGRSPGRFPAARLIHRVPRPRSGGFWHQDVYARAWRNAELGTRANKETSSHSLQDVSAASPVCRANANPPAADIPEQDSEEPGELTCPDSAFYRVLQWTIILVCE